MRCTRPGDSRKADEKKRENDNVLLGRNQGTPARASPVVCLLVVFTASADLLMLRVVRELPNAGHSRSSQANIDKDPAIIEMRTNTRNRRR